jgi:proteasome lid subunit RPN8/RPN11
MPAREDLRIRAHLCRIYPDEGCGVLLGRDGEGAREVVGVVPLENRHGDSLHNRYLVAPEQFLAAERAARNAGIEVIGFFHSHPDHPPRPSAFDLQHAWPYYSYLIVNVTRGEAAEARSWRLVDDRSRFEEERLEIREGSGEAGRADRPPTGERK